VAGDSVTVIDMRKPLRVKADPAFVVEGYVYLILLDLGDRAQLAIDHSLLCEWSAKLNAITFGE
jgi:hypothetical protein